MLSTTTTQVMQTHDDVERQFTVMVPYLTYEIERARNEAGLTMAELLFDLREQRENMLLKNMASLSNQQQWLHWDQDENLKFAPACRGLTGKSWHDRHAFGQSPARWRLLS